MLNEPDKNKDTVGRNGSADFITAIVLILFSIWAIFKATGYHSYSGPEIYIQPGFTPIVICSFIIVMSLVLLKDSLKGSSFKARWKEFTVALASGVTGYKFKNVVIALGIFALYIYVLLKYLPFWIATFVTIAFTFFYLKAGKPLKLIIIAGISTAMIIIIFQEIFAVPLP